MASVLQVATIKDQGGNANAIEIANSSANVTINNLTATTASIPAAAGSSMVLLEKYTADNIIRIFIVCVCFNLFLHPPSFSSTSHLNDQAIFYPSLSLSNTTSFPFLLLNCHLYHSIHMMHIIYTRFVALMHHARKINL